MTAEHPGCAPGRSILQQRTCPGRIVGGVFSLGISLIFKRPTCFEDPKTVWLVALPAAPVGTAKPSVDERREQLETLRRAGRLTAAEYERLRREILDDLWTASATGAEPRWAGDSAWPFRTRRGPARVPAGAPASRASTTRPGAWFALCPPDTRAIGRSGRDRRVRDRALCEIASSYGLCALQCHDNGWERDAHVSEPPERR